MKKGNETCEKKMLNEIGIGIIKITTNSTKGNKPIPIGNKVFFKVFTEIFIPDLPFTGLIRCLTQVTRLLELRVAQPGR